MSGFWWFLGGTAVGMVLMFVGLGLYIGKRMWR